MFRTIPARYEYSFSLIFGLIKGRRFFAEKTTWKYNVVYVLGIFFSVAPMGLILFYILSRGLRLWLYSFALTGLWGRNILFPLKIPTLPQEHGQTSLSMPPTLNLRKYILFSLWIENRHSKIVNKKIIPLCADLIDMTIFSGYFFHFFLDISVQMS